MLLDVNKIVNDKIAVLEESGAIQKQIEDSIEKTVMKAITDALEDYSLKRDIEKQVKECVSGVAAEIGFSAYNGFIAEKIKQITESVMHEDVAKKIQDIFDDMLIMKHDGIKLSEIFNKYRKWVCEDTDEADKWGRHTFLCELDDNEDGNFNHYTVKFHNEELDRYDKPEIEFRMCTYKKEGKSSISNLYLDGKNAGETFTLGHMSEIQSLLANLYFNKTEIILDIDDVDDSNHFDIDD